MGKEDRDFVRAAQQGAGPEAESAFAALVDRWKVPVFRFVLRRVRNHQDAEDVAAEVFVRAWRFLPGLEDPDRWGAWLLRIARNQVASHWEARGMSLQVRPVDDAFLDDRVEAAPVRVRDDLREALAAMPPVDLTLLRGKYEEHLTYADLAVREGVAVSTVRDRLKAARDRLTRVLQRAGLVDEWRRAMEARRGRSGGTEGLARG